MTAVGVVLIALAAFTAAAAAFVGAVLGVGAARRRHRPIADAVSRAWIAEHTETDGKSWND